MHFRLSVKKGPRWAYEAITCVLDRPELPKKGQSIFRFTSGPVNIVQYMWIGVKLRIINQTMVLHLVLNFESYIVSYLKRLLSCDRDDKELMCYRI